MTPANMKFHYPTLWCDYKLHKMDRAQQYLASDQKQVKQTFIHISNNIYIYKMLPNLETEMLVSFEIS